MAGERAARTAVWVACVGIGLLFLIRGATLPYFFPVFEHLTALSYAEIAVLLSLYNLCQAVAAPVAGWYADRTSIRLAVCTAIGLGGLSFFTISQLPAFVSCALAMSLAGVAFVLAKIALNTLLVDNCSQDSLRGSIAIRAALLNVGSFAGNLTAFYTIEWFGYPPLLYLLAGLNLTLAVVFFAPAAAQRVRSANVSDMRPVAAAIGRRAFLADGLRLLSIYLPYGCWGTIIPKYVIDVYNSNGPIRLVYFTSLVTTLVGSFVVNGFLARRLRERGFRWNGWIVLAQLCFCGGLVLLTFAGHQLVLAGAVVIFICGEIVMTPCLPEVAKRHAPPGKTGAYQGILHLFEGGGRVLGSTTAFVLYSWFKDTKNVHYFWITQTGLFLICFAAIHGLAYLLDRRALPARS
jgi:MFS family permease